ncbi:ACP S-malonyltransferase [Caballeronia arvi]|uniref:hypothetical protein n=1 Tax=Caballeronia arvi TaxID=1777135 RepID=UPI0007723F60|nr:hypothetical protein [Caballeronia arvi]
MNASGSPHLIAQLSSKADPVVLANINAETEMIVAGSDTAMHRLAAIGGKHGVQRCERLGVAVPSHCALLDAPAPRLPKPSALSRCVRRASCIYSSSVARPLFDGAYIAADLASNMARRVGAGYARGGRDSAREKS